MPLLSAVIITKNEAANIGGCLDSLGFCDERIVVDSGSTDRTVEIARQKGAQVSVHEWQGFGPQKNDALSRACGDWILSIDADERVTPALRDEILRAIAGGKADGFEMPRSSTFCGRTIWYSGWYPDYVLRLFRRDKGRFSDDKVHERVICRGTIGRLREPLIHHPVRRIEDALSKMDRYSTIGAEALVARRARVSFMTGLSHGLFAFFRAYILRRGFLDGREGLLLAVLQAEGTYYRYMKAWMAKRMNERASGLISVIVSTYEREDALDAVLRALSMQSDRQFEIIVADDGSGDATAKLVADWASRIGVPLHHVWHEHREFRAAEIRNRAIAASAGEVCIFLDGDCIPRFNFVARHRRLAEPGRFVAGHRALLSRELTNRILREKLEPQRWTWRAWIARRWAGEVNQLLPLLSLPLGSLRKLMSNRWRGVRTCNLAIWKKDLLLVDGFDANFSGWGLEDSDIAVRLINAGARYKDGRWGTGVLHLWHPPSDRSNLPENQRLLDEVIKTGRVRAIRGLTAVNSESSDRDGGT